MNNEVSTLLNQFASETFKKFKIIVQNIAKNDGFFGSLTFITIEGVSWIGNENKTLCVAVKMQKDDLKGMLKDVSEVIFEEEIFIYNEVFPAFENIQTNLVRIFRPYPRCLKCFARHNTLIFEDLKAQGYKMYNKDVPMDFEHCKKVMEVFGKFHALSFGLKNHNNSLFNKLATHVHKLSLMHVEKSIYRKFDVHSRSMEEALELLKEKGDNLLSEAMQAVVASWELKFNGYFDVDEQQSVFAHGDGWNNNMMFSYNEDNALESARLVDWQLADIRTPVYDICLFLYSSCGDFANFDKLISIYHESLVKFLVLLNTDPEVFTFQDLKDHLKKYTPFIIMHLPFLMKFVFSDGRIEDFDENSEDTIRFPPLKKDLIYSRIKSAFQHYYATYVK
ncbi:unnamed protein product [Acanthoscelides obtectus]|uniref:CHK kinase-like domain-containing protein n=1 Tax=Acanthoscelides obtectus TaxID=200917 RepID=A0A9P0LA20_ACAOB|nr:unnamed protein product [Acanthoscelides obtectus]CAK1659765.1 hypothetical protein AOBTE_LOCUS21665 [Acanthoscelides obtectus]